MRNIIMTTLLMALILASCAKVKKKPSTPSVTPTLTIEPETQWVDSLYNTMSLQEKVGQLFMVATYSNRNQSHMDSVKKLISDHHIGGLIFFQGGPVRQANQTNEYQLLSKVPLMIGIDGEWGLNMRLDSTARYPYNMTLGAIKDNDIVKQIGRQIGEDCKRMGIHINFAPDVDINTNSKNPVIGVRSFGEDKFNVTEKAIAFTEGMQGTGVLGSAKHFPGHGDTDTDSHKTLPTVSFDSNRIDSVELYPYKQLFRKGVAGVMVAHLNVPSLETQENLPSSLSYSIVTKLLKEKLGFKGLIFTDALNMKGAADYLQPGDIDLAAFQAGNDVLLFTEDAPTGISKIMDAYNENIITEERLAHSVKKILTAKFNVGLNQYAPIEIDGLWEDLNKDVNATLYAEAIESAVTLIKNEGQALPLSKESKEDIAFISLGNGPSEVFLKALNQQGSVTDVSKFSNAKLKKELKAYDKVIISYHRKNSRLTHAISAADKKIIEAISKDHNTILVLFASQYSLKETDLASVESVLVSYENSEVANSLSAEMIFGETEPKGELPASISKAFPVHSGISITP